MSQPKNHSILESVMNVIIGMSIGFTVNILWGVPAAKTLGITLSMTILSILRTYIVRRYFNNLHVASKLPSDDLGTWEYVCKGSKLVISQDGTVLKEVIKDGD